MKVLLSAVLLSSLLITPVQADNSQADHPIRIEMSGHDSRFKQVADVEKVISRMMVAFDTGIHLQDIRYKRVEKLEGADYGMEIHVGGHHLGTYRVWERPESTKTVVLVYPRH